MARSLGNIRSLGNVNQTDKKDEVSLKEKVVRGVSDAAPVVGGIAGGLAGAVVGLPALGLGAIPGGAFGTAAGTGAGLAFGETLENLAGLQDETMGQLAKESIVEPLTAGAIDAATAGTMKAISPLTKPLVEGGAGFVRGMYRMFIPKNSSVKTYASVFKTSRKISERLKPENVAQEMVKHGLYGDLDDLANTANKITGESGIVSKITRNLVGKIDEGVETGKAIESLSNAVDSATVVDRETLKKMRTQISNILSKGERKTPTAINALDALDAQRQLEKLGYGILNSAEDSLTSGDKKLMLEQQAKLYLDVADEIGNGIDKLGEKISAIDSFKTPEILNELKQISPRLAKQFNSASNVSELRSIAAPFVKLQKLIQATKSYGGSAFIDTIGGKPGITSTILDAVRRPESVTSMAVAQNKLGESPVGAIQTGIERAGSGITNTLTNSQTEIARILAQLGLTPR